jgi:predicted TIM-barrel fold metal-dependent hydrolase
MPSLHRIDVHHHPSPPSYLAARESGERANPQRQTWTAQQSLDCMDEGGVKTSMLSLPHSVSVWPDGGGKGGGARSRAMAREWNEYMARMAADHKAADGSPRFGVYATLPALDVEGCLKEIEYAMDTLKADGVNFMTNIGDRWLGDEHYWPIFEELNRRKAVVYTHPVQPDCCNGIYREFNEAVIEYGTDTTRAIAKLIFTGATVRFPDIRFIFSHAGGTMPFIAERFLRAYEFGRPDVKARMTNGVMPEIQRLWYDTAQAATVWAMASFTKLVPTSQLLFGTDYPYRTAEETARGLRECGCLSDAELRAVDYENALRLHPHLKRG